MLTTAVLNTFGMSRQTTEFKQQEFTRLVNSWAEFFFFLYELNFKKVYTCICRLSKIVGIDYVILQLLAVTVALPCLNHQHT